MYSQCSHLEGEWQSSQMPEMFVWWCTRLHMTDLLYLLCSLDICHVGCGGRGTTGSRQTDLKREQRNHQSPLLVCLRGLMWSLANLRPMTGSLMDEREIQTRAIPTGPQQVMHVGLSANFCNPVVVGTAQSHSIWICGWWNIIAAYGFVSVLGFS